MLINEDADIFFLQETFLSPEIPDSLIIGATDYQIYRCDRPKRTGGGVALIIHTRLQSIHIHTPPQIELVAADIKSPFCNYRLICAYRPPNSGLTYSQSLCDALLALDSDQHITIMVGDFNLPRLYSTTGHTPAQDPISTGFDQLTDSLALQQLNLYPSRPNSANILDLILCPAAFSHHLSSISLCEEFLNSDHFGLSFSLSFGKKPIPPAHSYRNFRKGNYSSMSDYFDKIDWIALYHSSPTIESFTTDFISLINNAINLYVPMVNAHKSRKLPSSIIRLRRKKRKCFNKRLKNQEAYKKASKTYAQAIKNHTLQVERDLIDQGSHKNLYSHVKKRTTDNSKDFPLTDNGSLINDDSVKADTFSNFFSSVYTASNGNIPQMAPLACEQLSSVNLSTFQVRKILHELKPKLSSGPDDIPMFLFKKVSNQISLPLSILFYWSFTSSTCPKNFLETKVIPVFKRKGKRSEVENYRPISLGSSIAKIMEKIITNRLLSHFISNDLISTKQHGFLPNRSTTTQLLSCVNDWTTAKANRIPCYVIYLDFKKAFDSVDHLKLMAKLQAYGITGNLLAWIRAYLDNRVQRVSINTSYSAPKQVLSGILQGSCIGPLLFIAYINDLLESLTGVQVAAYADDIKLYGPDPNLLQSALDTVSNWCDAWQLMLSPTKCCSISLSNGPHHVFTINGTPLPQSPDITDLGVLIDQSLDFSSHIEAMVKKAKQTSWITLKCFSSGNRQNLLRAYTTYVRPKLEYCPQIWSPQTQANIKLIERVQKHYTKRMFYRCGFKKQPYEERLKRLQLDTLESRRTRLDLVLAHKIYHENTHCPDVLQKKTIQRTLVHNFRLQKDIHVPNFRSLFFSNRIVNLWNKFTDEQIQFTSTDFHNLLFPVKD